MGGEKCGVMRGKSEVWMVSTFISTLRSEHFTLTTNHSPQPRASPSPAAKNVMWENTGLYKNMYVNTCFRRQSVGAAISRPPENR